MKLNKQLSQQKVKINFSITNRFYNGRKKRASSAVKHHYQVLKHQTLRLKCPRETFFVAFLPKIRLKNQNERSRLIVPYRIFLFPRWKSKLFVEQLQFLNRVPIISQRCLDRVINASHYRVHTFRTKLLTDYLYSTYYNICNTRRTYYIEINQHRELENS